ncbi:hypothetical protein FB567DRAFT_532638 [Paraphoma chrysanthemicola]|uniref:DUF7730 domain-containing protein n=1 Tax=Paraphoma chrysanthemicola TaxID=798071 RepID=A0A8K0VUT1_9PLEO|nr:hypothetical protein FB567DRAFT_532638 [Paraphoma chrysanthemicola]
MNMATNASIDADTHLQRYSRFFQLPHDIQRLIYEALVPSAVHIQVREGRTIVSKCASPQAMDEEDDGESRREGLPFGGGKWNFEDTHIHAQRLRSCWGPHWRCEELARKTRGGGLTGLLSVCKTFSVEVREVLIKETTWNVAHSATVLRLVETTARRHFLGQAIRDIRRLDITLRLPLAVFTMIENRTASPSNVSIHDTHVSEAEDSIASQADKWLQICASVSQLKSLSRLRVWLDHDQTDYWAKINERAFLEPVVQSLERSEVKISFHLPLLNPAMETAHRHFLEPKSAANLTVVRRVRQHYHGIVNSQGRLFVISRGDFPLLDIGSYPFEDLNKEELRSVERKLWEQGIDVQHELVDGGSWPHDGGWEFDEYIEPQIIKREQELGRSLNWDDIL